MRDIAQPIGPTLLIKFSNRSGYLDQIVQGILAYPAAKLRWEVFSEIGDAPISSALRRHADFDALITHTMNDLEVEALAKWSKPTILVEQDSVLGLPTIRADDHAVGRMAFDYFARRGYTNFAYVGPPAEKYSNNRQEGFFEGAMAAGHVIFGCQDSVHVAAQRVEASWADFRNGKGLHLFPIPMAVLVDNSYHGQSLTLACRRLGIAVPEQMAILAVDDDEVLCDGCAPPLSAINQGTFQIGYQASAMLERWLNGQPPEQLETRVPPAGLTERQSTNTFAVSDPYLRQALLYIRSHAVETIKVGDVLKHVPVSRRHLEILFKEKIGRTIHDEILLVRLEHVKELLRATNMPLAEIADRTGFDYPTKMSHAFKREIGCTPSAYRHAYHEI
jgi:LacI family transcriptional regulator